MTKWVDQHPGGYLPLVNIAGGDATDNFLAYHPAYVWTDKLPYFCIGTLHRDETTVSPFVQEYRDMRIRFLEQSAFHGVMSHVAAVSCGPLPSPCSGQAGG